MSDVDSGATAILDFMTVRAPEPLSDAVLHRNYVLDGDFGLTQSTRPESVEDYSSIGEIVTRHVFAPQVPDDAFEVLIDELLAEVGPVVVGPAGDTTPDAPRPVSLSELDAHACVEWRGQRYVLPSRLADLRIMPGIAATRVRPGATEAEAVAELRRAFGQDLSQLVFDGSGREYKDDFVESVRRLFDALYRLYVLRRLGSVDMGEIIGGLRLLHLLRACALDETYDRTRSASSVDARDQAILELVAPDYPPTAFPLVSSPADVAALLAARPVVHPIFARLFGLRKPFNDLTPLGIGDFKVVKQKLVEYLPGEICDIHNVMKGETKERVHRHLEKNEETYTFTSSFEEDTSKDTQSTDRFELKREVENTLKTDLNLNANASVRYDNKVVLATVGAGFAYNRADGTVDKTAQNFSHEVVTKAVSRVQTRTSEQRAITRIVETEETNKHGFSSPAAHTSGIYRWVDKHYEAQLHNYGKRMMFEFVLPEPAALFVASRLRGFEAALTVPQMPADPTYTAVALPVATPADISPEKFAELRLAYDLSAFTYPPTTKTVSFVDTLSGGSMITDKDIDGSDKWFARTLKCSFPGATGHELTRLSVTGQMQFDDHHQPPENDADRNLMRISIDGSEIGEYQNDTIYVGVDRESIALGQPFVFVRDDVDVVLAFQDVELYKVMMNAELTLTAAALADWQTRVFQAVQKAERSKVEQANRDVKLAYDQKLSAYRTAMGELEATALNDLLQGGAEAVNAETIRLELRRQVLAMITKELTTLDADDLLTTWEPMGSRSVDHLVTKLDVDEKPDATTVVWRTTGVATGYPVPDLAVARRKARYVQFLEQAFDWENLAYLFYPYFWATPPKWMELLARHDDTDPTMTAFLRAGAARVLVAVTPAYDDAVLHFLATREPWEGGPAPVIGDPLYLPLHEELRKQQDDLYGAVADGDPWEFTVPTTLVYLHGSDTSLPDLVAEREERQEDRT